MIPPATPAQQAQEEEWDAALEAMKGQDAAPAAAAPAAARRAALARKARFKKLTPEETAELVGPRPAAPEPAPAPAPAPASVQAPPVAATTVSPTVAPPVETSAPEKRGRGRPKKAPVQPKRRKRVNVTSSYEEVMDAIRFGAEQVAGHRALPVTPKTGKKQGIDLDSRVQAQVILIDAMRILYRKTAQQVAKLRQKEGTAEQVAALEDRLARIEAASPFENPTDQRAFVRLSTAARKYDSTSGLQASARRLGMDNERAAQLEGLSLQMFERIANALGESTAVDVPEARAGELLGVLSSQERKDKAAGTALQKAAQDGKPASSGPIDTVSLDQLEEAGLRVGFTDADSVEEAAAKAEREPDDPVADQLASDVGLRSGSAPHSTLTDMLTGLLNGRTYAEVAAVAPRARDFVAQSLGRGKQPGPMDLAESRALVEAWFEDPNLEYMGLAPTQRAMNAYMRKGMKDKIAVALSTWMKERGLTAPRDILDQHTSFMNSLSELMGLDTPIFGDPNVTEIIAESHKAAVDLITRRISSRLSPEAKARAKADVAAAAAQRQAIPARKASQIGSRPAAGVAEYFDTAYANGGQTHWATDFVKGLLEVLSPASAEARVLRRLLQRGTFKDATIQLNAPTDNPNDFGQINIWTLVDGKLYPGRSIVIAPRAFGVEGMSDAEVGGELLHTLVHESIHLATGVALDTNADFRARIEQLLEVARANIFGRHYGLTNVHEFLAEALANPQFQRALRGVTANGQLTLWQRLKNAIRSLLGLPVSVRTLDQILDAEVYANSQSSESREVLGRRVADFFAKHRSEHAQEFGWYPTHAESAQWLNEHGIVTSPDIFDASHPLRALGEAGSMFNRAVSTGMSSFSSLTELSKAANLGFMDLDVMERKYRALFDRFARRMGWKHNPLTRLVQSIQRAASASRDLIRRGIEVTELMEQLNGDDKLAVSVVMRDATMARVHPELPLNSPRNAHLKKPEELADARAVIDKYNALSDAAKNVYAEARDVLTLAFSRRRKALMQYTGQTAQLTPEQMEDFINIRSEADIAAFEAKWEGTPDARGNPLVLDEQVVSLLKRVSDLATVQGPYFPLTRDGEVAIVEYDTRYPTDKHRVMYFANPYELEKWVTDAKAAGDIPQDWKYATVAVRKEDVLPGELKQVSAVIAGAFKNPDMRNEVRQIITEMLAEASLHGRSLKRKYVPGVHAESMLGAFRDYVAATSYAVGDLTEGYSIEENLTLMRVLESSAPQDERAVDARGNPRSVDASVRITKEEGIEVGRVRREFSKRLQEQARDRNVGQFERAIGAIGFFNYLGAPSYWLLNLLQNATVGVAALATNQSVSYSDSARAITRAMAVLSNAAGPGGLMAKGKNVYNVEALIASLPPQYAALTQYLFDENVIGSTLAQEFGSMLSDNPLLKLRPVKAVAHVLQAVPQTIEYFNRIAMAIAAYDLATGTEEQRRLAARDVTQMSHFNYSPENRARLLKTFPTRLGGAAEAVVRPIMMFKVYGVNLFRLVYGSAYDALKGDTPEQRQRAKTMLFGLLGSHVALGGIFGGLGLGVVEIAGAAINALLDDDEEINWGAEIDQWLTELTNDYVARVITRGLPAAFGADMSSSINLGNMLFMLPDADLAATGGVERQMIALGGPMVGLVARDIRAVAQFADDGVSLGSTAELIAKLTPLKLVRDLQESFALADGMETANGQEFMSADEVPFTAIAMRGFLGLRPAVATQRQDQFYSARDRTVTLERMKSKLQGAWIAADNPSDRSRAIEAIMEFNQRARQARNYSLVISRESLRRAEDAREQRQREYSAGRYTPYNRQ